MPRGRDSASRTSGRVTCLVEDLPRGTSSTQWRSGPPRHRRLRPAHGPPWMDVPTVSLADAAHRAHWLVPVAASSGIERDWGTDTGFLEADAVGAAAIAGPSNAPWPGSPVACDPAGATNAMATTSSPSPASPAPSSATADSPNEVNSYCLPPYAPDLDPAEGSWSLLRRGQLFNVQFSPRNTLPSASWNWRRAIQVPPTPRVQPQQQAFAGVLGRSFTGACGRCRPS